MEVKNRELINTSTEWVSPTSIEEVLSPINVNDWVNLDNVLDWESKEFASIEKGVRKNVASRPIKCSGFNFNIEEENYEIQYIEMRLLVINDTQGGTKIKDNYAKIYNKNCNIKTTFWKEDASELRTFTLNSSSISDINNITFEYSCIGTGTDYQIPQIYGIQGRVVYTYYKEIEVSDTPQYEVKASLESYELLSNKTTTTLTLNRFTSNGMSGLFGNVYINLSDNLSFNDNKRQKIIKAVNTNNVWSKTDKFLIKGNKQGLGKITISSSSMSEPIILYLNVDNDVYYNENVTILESNDFNMCHATKLGGAIYNNSYLNNINSYYNGNTAQEGNDLYNALTNITTSLSDEYEAGVISFSCEVTFQNQTKTVNYGYVKLYDNGIEVDSAEVNNNGKAIFNHNFEGIGTHNLKFVYINRNITTDTIDYNYGNSYLRKTIKITKKNPILTLIDYEGNEVPEDYILDVQQNTHMLVKLIDKDTSEPLTGRTLIWNEKKYITDELGIAYLMVMEKIGNLDISIKYNGDDVYREITLKRTINVTLKKVQLLTNDLYTRINVKDNYNVKLLDLNGNPLVDKKIYIYMENTIDEKGIKDYSYETSSSGVISIPIKLHKGVWVVTNTFESDGVYKTERTYNTIVCYDKGFAESKIILNNTTISGVPSDNITISGQLVDVLGQSGLKRDLQVIAIDKINNKKVYKQFKSNIYGDFSVDLTLEKGEYIFQVIFLGDTAYDGCLESGNISILRTGDEPCIIQSADYKGKYSAISDFKVILTDEDNNPLVNRKILFNFKKSNKEWIDYTVYTNEKGIAIYPLKKLDFGVYLVKTSFLGDSNYKGTTNKNIVVITYGNDVLDSLIRLQSETIVNEKYRVTFVLSDKSNVLANQYCNIVTYDQNGYIDNTKVVTNDNGGFYIDIDKTPQLTIVQAIYPGSSIYSDYEYLHVYYEPKKVGTITAIEGTKVELFEGENKYYTSTLKDDKGNLLKEKYICTEIIHSDKSREVVYNVSNELGQIDIELSNLKPDIYTFKSYFAGDETYRSCVCSSTVKVNQNDNKIPTIIVGGDKEYNYTQANEKGIYEVELTAGVLGELNAITRSTPLKGKNITFLIEDLNTGQKSTQIALTDANGKAYISIKDWVGEFKITYTFLGDSQYAQSEETSILTITASEELPSILEAYDTEVKYGETKNINIRLMSTLPTDINVADEGNPIGNASIEIHFINRITQQEYLIDYNSPYAQITNSQGRIKFGLLTNNFGEIDENKQNFFKTGLYDVIIKFLGNNIYQPCEKTVVLNILPKDKLENVKLTAINKKIDIDDDGNEILKEYVNVPSIKMSVNDSSILAVCLESQAVGNRPVIYDYTGEPMYYIEGDYVLLEFYDRANKKISYTVTVEEKKLDYDNEYHSVVEFDCGILEGGVYDCYIIYPTQTHWKQKEELRIQIEIIPKIPTLVLLNNDNTIVDSLSFKYTTKGYIKVGLFYEDKFSSDTLNISGTDVKVKWLDNEYIYFVYNGVSYSGITGQGDLEDGNKGIKGVAQLSINRIEGLNAGENYFSTYNLTTNNIESNVLNFILNISAEDGAYLSGFSNSIIHYGKSENNYNYVIDNKVLNINLYYDEVLRGGESSQQRAVSNVDISLDYWYYSKAENRKITPITLSAKTDANGMASFDLPIRPPSDLMKTNSNDQIDANGGYFIYLKFTVNSDIYVNLNQAGEEIKIMKTGYVEIKKRDIIFNVTDYSYNEPIISFSFYDNQYSSNSKREGKLLIDIDKKS